MRFRIALPLSVALALFGVSVPAAVLAQDAWPAKPVRIIVGALPGGAIDGAARIIASEFSKTLGSGSSSRTASARAERLARQPE